MKSIHYKLLGAVGVGVVIGAGLSGSPFGRVHASPLPLAAHVIDHSAVDWGAIPVSPDPSPLSVAAYDP